MKLNEITICLKATFYRLIKKIGRLIINENEYYTIIVNRNRDISLYNYKWLWFK